MIYLFIYFIYFPTYIIFITQLEKLADVFRHNGMKSTCISDTAVDP